MGNLSDTEVGRIIIVLKILGFEITHPLMEINDEQTPLLQGLQEFREHLGGRLTITLLAELGKGIEVHEMDTELLKRAATRLKHY